MPECLLQMRGVSKYFPGVKALDGVDFDIRAGEVQALIGENGAGKSTLVKVLTGIYQPSQGSILLQGKPVVFKQPSASRGAGIAAIHQEAAMFPELTVTENIYMGHHLKGRFMGMLDWAAMKRMTGLLLDRLELSISPETKVKDLSVAQRHLVEIAKALSREARIVIMDEPTSALSLREAEHLYRIIRQLKAQGKAIVFISHKFEDIYQVADTFTVLRDGQSVGRGEVAGTELDDIVRMMVGRSLKQMYPQVEVEPGAVLLEVEGLSRSGVFKEVSFTLHRGEVLGFFGLIGSGRSEVMQTLFGIQAADSGSIRIKGQAASIAGPREAMRYGLAYVPEDRQLQGAILEMNIRENSTLPLIDQLSGYTFLDIPRELDITRRYGERMEIKASSWEQQVNDLSGGNQQKVVLAKWLATEPQILIMDEPTRGIDVATKARVHRFIAELARQGLGIILVSSELPEILGMSHSVVVMHEGEVTARFRREEAASQPLLKAAMGAPSN